MFDPLIVNDFLQQEDAERLNAELAGEGDDGHADQQVDHEELGVVQDATATDAEYSQENAQEVDQRDISQDSTNGPAEGPSLPPPTPISPRQRTLRSRPAPHQSPSLPPPYSPPRPGEQDGQENKGTSSTNELMQEQLTFSGGPNVIF